MKKLFALILSCVMVMSLCVVPVSAVRIFNTGDIIISDDFEDYTIVEEGKQIPDRGTYSYYYLPLTSHNGEQVYSTRLPGFASGLEWMNKLTGAQEIDYGQIAISYTITVSSSYDGELSGDYYPSLYHGHWNGSTYIPFFVVGMILGNEAENLGGVMLSGAYGLSSADVASGEVYTFSADEPHDIMMVIDYDNTTTTLYVDGNEAGSISRVIKLYSGATSYIAVKPHASVTSTYATPDGDGDVPEFMIHKWKIEKYTPAGANFIYTTTTDENVVADMGSVVPAGTKKISINFAETMDPATLNATNITVDGDLGNGTYQVYPDLNDDAVAIVEFSECLMPGEEYKLIIGPNVSDGSDTLGQYVEVAFAADAGTVNYHVPEISVSAAADVTLGSPITFEAEIVNSAKVDASAYLILAAYKDGMLTGLEKTTYNYDSDVDPYKMTVSKTFNATEGFVGADELKAWYISDITNIKPLAAPVSVQ